MDVEETVGLEDLLARAPGWVIVACGVAGGAMLLPRETVPMISGPVATIYPWWTWLLPAVLVLTGLVLVRWPRPAVAVVAAVAAAQLAGTGVVGLKHWTPVMGYTGGSMHQIEVLRASALGIASGSVLALACAVAVVRASGRLRSWPWSTRTALAVAAGGLVLVVVPVLLASTAGEGRVVMFDVTSFGAIALIYSLPWGVTLAVSGWLDGVVADAARLAVVASAGVAMVGPQMLALIHGNEPLAFGVAGAVAALLLVVGRLMDLLTRPPASATIDAA